MSLTLYKINRYKAWADKTAAPRYTVHYREALTELLAEVDRLKLELSNLKNASKTSSTNHKQELSAQKVKFLELRRRLVTSEADLGDARIALRACRARLAREKY